MTDDPEYYLNNELSWFEHITPETVGASLADFPLQSRHSKRWLAGSIRRVYFCTVGSDFEDYPGITHVKAELEQISESLKSVIARLENRSGWAESVLRRHASIIARESAGDDWPDGITDDLTEDDKLDVLYEKELALQPDNWWAEGSIKLARCSPEWKTLREQVKGLYWLQSFIYTATEELCSHDDPPRWRDMERRKQRISFATWLSPVFEDAYGKRATVNNWTGDDGQAKLGDWPEFFNRIACLALKLDRIPDLQGILKEARRAYKKDREGIFSPYFPDENPP